MVKFKIYIGFTDLEKLKPDKLIFFHVAQVQLH